jgi:hypothetical protein
MNNSQTTNLKSFLLDKLEGLPSKEHITNMIQKFYNDNNVVIDTATTIATGVSTINDRKYYMSAYIENIKIAKKLLYRIRELTHKIQQLHSHNKNAKYMLCTQNDFIETVAILENRINANSDMKVVNKLIRKMYPHWYYEQITFDIQLIGTLLNMLNLDFNIFNHAYTLTDSNNLDECKISPHIETDTSYVDDIKSSYKYCVDGVCNIIKPYVSQKTKKKEKRGRTKKNTRKT